MRVLGEWALLKEIKGLDSFGMETTEAWEVAFVGKGIEGVNVGDRVFFQHGVTVEIKGQQYRLVSAEELICIIE